MTAFPGGEGYCRICFKVVPMQTGIAASWLITHFTFAMISMARPDSGPKPCVGRRPDNTITHYMDDPNAAFE